MKNKELPEPWNSFLLEVDGSLDADVVFHCFGGFAITMLFGLPRATEDVDIVGAVVREGREQLLSIAGKGSPLHVKHRLYLDLVGTIAVIPDEYESRLIPIKYDSFDHIKLFVMEPHDIILAKLGRDAPKDIHDVMYLAKVTKIDTAVLRSRYNAELSPYVIGPPDREARKLDYWIEMIEEANPTVA